MPIQYTKLSMLLMLLVSVASLPLYGQNFTYDSSGRVTQVTYAGGANIKYKYDAAGNLKKVKSTLGITASISADEPNGNTLRFEMHRTGDLSQSLTVALTATGDAVDSRDYSSLPPNVVFPAHESSTSFSVALKSDRPASSGKKLVVSLTEGDEYGLDKDSSATVILPEKK